MSDSVKLIECPRDAWQGLKGQIPPDIKRAYLQALISAGFKHIDAVSFVSPKAVPQNKDWFAYKTSEESPQGFLAEAVGKELGQHVHALSFIMLAGAMIAAGHVVPLHARRQRQPDHRERGALAPRRDRGLARRAPGPRARPQGRVPVVGRPLPRLPVAPCD